MVYTNFRIAAFGQPPSFESGVGQAWGKLVCLPHKLAVNRIGMNPFTVEGGAARAPSPPAPVRSLDCIIVECKGVVFRQ